MTDKFKVLIPGGRRCGRTLFVGKSHPPAKPLFDGFVSLPLNLDSHEGDMIREGEALLRELLKRDKRRNIKWDGLRI